MPFNAKPIAIPPTPSALTKLAGVKPGNTMVTVTSTPKMSVAT
ncbi:hypothetical protein [Hymenobacter jeongseonensis]|nr:hypothetical protein [Hymenobacter jeongseonensis]